MRRLLRSLVILALLAPPAACGGEEDSTTSTTETLGTSADSDPAPSDEKRRDAGRNSTSDGGEPSEARRVTRIVRDYVNALDDRDGERVCELLARGAIDGLELPRDRGRCAPSLTASIGYEDPRGLPVWKTARVGEILSAEVNGNTAKVVATTITLFADREEPSVEDDVVYLVRPGERWLIAKPSSTLYRAVGIADIPPSVLAPP